MSLPDRSSRAYLAAVPWLTGLIRAIVRPRPRTRIWKWLDQHVKVPESSGGPNPGRLRTGRFPIFRGLFDLAQQRHVHFLTICSSARAGKTLFSICLVLYWISERFGAVVWLDPTRNSARKLVRDELDEFLLECAPVRALAIISKKTWTTLEKCFRGKRFRIVGSGAEADLHGFNAECAIENELDACRTSTEADAASADKIEARTKLFASSRLIVRNSTPQKGEFGPTWPKFLLGTQHHCYVPCPHCTAAAAVERGLTELKFVPPDEEAVTPGRSPLSYDPRLAGWQRFTFFSEKRSVPFDEGLDYLRDATGAIAPRSAWREEVTGAACFDRFAIMEERPTLADPTRTELVRVGWNLKRVRRGTTYRCAGCQKEIEQIEQGWMLARFRWMAHNPDPDPADQDDEDAAPLAAVDEHISAHVWSWYSPFEQWGVIAAEFLEAKGDLGRLIKFWVYTLGRPFIRQGAGIREDDLDRVIGRCPVRYVQGQIPFEAEILTITIDRQGAEMWFVIRAWGILWDHPEWQSWSALVDWGEATSWPMILEKCGHAADAEGHLRRFKFTLPDGTVREYMVTSGLADAGFEQQAVWDYCLTQEWLSPARGGDTNKTGGNDIRIAQVMDERLEQIWFWSDHFASNLYFDCIKDGSSHHGVVNWWLPTNLDEKYRKQLTDEYLGEKDGKRTWMTRTKTNHMGDCEKMQRVLSGKIEELLDDIREVRAAEIAAAAPPEAARASEQVIRERVRALTARGTGTSGV